MVRAAIPAAVLVLGLSACGKGDSPAETDAVTDATARAVLRGSSTESPPSPAPAVASDSLRIRVRNADGSGPVGGIRVRLESGSGAPDLEAVTDADGFVEAPPDAWVWLVSMDPAWTVSENMHRNGGRPCVCTAVRWVHVEGSVRAAGDRQPAPEDVILSYGDAWDWGTSKRRGGRDDPPQYLRPKVPRVPFHPLADGSFRGAVPRSPFVRLRAAAPGFRPTWVDVSSAREGDRFALVLEPVPGISGRVVDAAGTPAGGRWMSVVARARVPAGGWPTRFHSHLLQADLVSSVRVSAARVEETLRWRTWIATDGTFRADALVEADYALEFTREGEPPFVVDVGSVRADVEGLRVELPFEVPPAAPGDRISIGR